ncbi:uncharacterized protein PHACADRAFT_167498 [Phanerochaete carnosa HHB-10118-sp]|uniref:Uncharacterized protein n=1 Tax=Phanerochaete carnosa (strain HHB-10118-sp) TaxID=650164 RepID=K5VVW6_PHACS|nr:uncharacterized protein PHACADRAFT_256509 [Phanerochaete carnosa HHB-10118-sp]XP_007402978.1 uncharacterized protein PHACADRAFT_167498 [Phanerochaete carnosa HHB-10118-sp]EKM48471.1 hypothetical protein PHACADRAFT_167498 [Phanerochaete carnosa HHB-10118-sp]EKM55698.1 hypothetical protein PHACADRAFT_256509 [Phanerochaete carnosa HHB-10118-sp]
MATLQGDAYDTRPTPYTLAGTSCRVLCTYFLRNTHQTSVSPKAALGQTYRV